MGRAVYRVVKNCGILRVPRKVDEERKGSRKARFPGTVDSSRDKLSEVRIAHTGGEMQSDIGQYLQSWSAELISRADRVRLLIGDAHWLSDGHHKESLLREFLRRYLPPGMSVTRGFIKPPDDSMPCSPEIDILISDAAMHPPLFAEGELVIAPPSSILAFLEAKSTFSKGKLLESLRGQARTRETLRPYVRDCSIYWSGITFATIPEGRSLASCLTTINDTIAELNDTFPWFTVRHLPKCIGTFSESVFFIRATGETAYQIRGFETGQLSIACLFADLSSSIASRYGRKLAFGELATVVTSISTNQDSLSGNIGRREGQGDGDDRNYFIG